MYNQIDSNKRQSIVLTMIFIAVLISLGYVVEMSLGWPQYSGITLAVVISLFMTLLSYFQGDKIALWSSGAKPIVKEDNAYLYNLVENLCITAGMLMPKLYIMEDTAINAFATGRKPDVASIAVTRGALQKLENEELEGVLAHELSHIQNYDIRFMTMVAVLVGAIALLADIFLRARWLGLHSDNRRSGGGQVGAVLAIAGIVLAILSPLIANLIKLAISRRREYLADASGSLLTRYPEGLARALEKIAADHEPMKKASNATAHLFISNPFGSKKKMSAIFSTHPPIEERIAKLRGMA
ncbi:MAG TPA: M48 family metallopeptidase [Patescibacteria group bacterium]|nr:M48 family metallopeptidase [Patescibacteria group bacterium]